MRVHACSLHIDYSIHPPLATDSIKSTRTCSQMGLALSYVPLVCTHTGGAEGLGKEREKELHAAGEYWGAASVEVIDDPLLPDGMHTHWDERVIAGHVTQFVGKHQIDIVSVSVAEWLSSETQRWYR
eukprot:GHVU01052271.1.p1 GENE.GHVU01052271.1~~GHVU01052271.1.p1  ORF type:complete len:127 (+),score=11.55 GHVU01052271.1:454-834(+)